MTRVEAQEALRSCLVAFAITVAAELAFAAIDAHVLGFWPNSALDLTHALLVGGAAAWLWSQRRAPDPARCDRVFLLAALGFLPIFWVGELTAARLGLVREPLIPHQMVMVGVALLAPANLALGAALIALITLDAIVLWVVLRDQYPLPGVSGEPWTTLVFAAVSASFLVARARRRTMAHRLAQARAEAEAHAGTSRIFLALRDWANSPLQTLEVGLALLERRFADARALLGPMRAAVERLKELSATLAHAEQPRATGERAAETTGERAAEPPVEARRSNRRPAEES